MLKIAYVGYDFEASLSVDRVLLKSGEPFGKIVGKKLVFQFPVMLSFLPMALTYYKGEISLKENGELSCVLTQIKELDKEYNGKFTAKDIDLATPPEGKKMTNKYTLTLKPAEKK